jgi:hypothetical protein
MSAPRRQLKSQASCYDSESALKDDDVRTSQNSNDPLAGGGYKPPHRTEEKVTVSIGHSFEIVGKRPIDGAVWFDVKVLDVNSKMIGQGWMKGFADLRSEYQLEIR